MGLLTRQPVKVALPALLLAAAAQLVPNLRGAHMSECSRQGFGEVRKKAETALKRRINYWCFKTGVSP